MASKLIVKVRTPFVVLEIRGPVQEKVKVGVADNRRRSFSVSASTGPIDLFTGASGEWSSTSPDAIAAFHEDTLYRIRVVSLVTGVQPVLLHRDVLLFQDVDAYSDTLSLTGPFSFRRQVGYSDFAILVGGLRLNVTVEVMPTKIDYAEDYEALLVDIAEASRGLALEYMRSTYRTSAVTDVASQSNLEWLTLLRNEIDGLDDAVRFIDAHPRRALARESKLSRIESIRANDSTARRAIATGKGAGAWASYEQFGRVRQFVDSHKPFETLDTPEHRWLRHNLILALARLRQLEQGLNAQAESATRRLRRPTPRFLAEIREVSNMSKQLRELLALPIFQHSVALPPHGFGSLQLHTAAGYGDAYRALTVLRQGLDVTSYGAQHHSLSDLHELYEVWCFIAVVKLVLRISGGEAELGDLLGVSEDGIRLRLIQGRRSSVRVQRDHGALEVVYNWSFKGLTGSQRPDITLRFMRADWPDLYVVLDAKYRVDASPEVIGQYGIAAPPPDAINALHRYRDAIVVSTGPSPLSRPVVKGAALYPLAEEDARSFDDSGLQQALETLGIGAIPFLPNNQAYLEHWLRQLLSLTPEQLSKPGPPFSGIEHMNSR